MANPKHYSIINGTYCPSCQVVDEEGSAGACENCGGGPVVSIVLYRCSCSRIWLDEDQLENCPCEKHKGKGRRHAASHA